MSNATQLLAWLVIIVVGFSVVVGGCAGFQYATETTLNTVVTDKSSVNYHGSSTKFLVFTESGETFKVDDTLAYFRWNSADVYGNLKVGHKYKFKVTGWRLPFFSVYRNIVGVEEVATQQ